MYKLLVALIVLLPTWAMATTDEITRADSATVSAGKRLDVSWASIDSLVGNVLIDGDATFEGPQTISTSSGALTMTPTTDVLHSDGTGAVIGHTAQVSSVIGASEMQILGTGNTDASMIIGRHTSDANGPFIIAYNSRNATIGSSTAITSGDATLSIIGAGDDGTDFNTQSCRIDFDTEGTIGSNRIPGVMIFKTSTDAAPGVMTERMRIDSEGQILVTKSSGTNSALVVETDADLGNSRYGIFVSNDQSQTGTTSALLYAQDTGTGTNYVSQVYSASPNNSATFMVNEAAAKATGKYSSYFYTNSNQQEEALVRVHSDNASSDHGGDGVVYILNDGGNYGLRIDNTKTSSATAPLRLVTSHTSYPPAIISAVTPAYGDATNTSANLWFGAGQVEDDDVYEISSVDFLNGAVILLNATGLTTHNWYETGIWHFGDYGGFTHMTSIVEGGNGVINESTANLSGTTGTDTQCTISAIANSGLEFENRSGNTLWVYWLAFGG